jgi:hypothetical protein
MPIRTHLRVLLVTNGNHPVAESDDLRVDV